MTKVRERREKLLRLDDYDSDSSDIDLSESDDEAGDDARLLAPGAGVVAVADVSFIDTDSCEC